MKTKVAAIYGKRDVRLREFELPEITDNELLVSVISDSVCLSTWKAALLGSEHKRVPDDLENHPVITGHECAGVIVEVGKNLTGKYKKGQRGSDSNLLIVFYVQIMPDDLVMQLHRF